jgi:hypothetical protein
MGIGRKNFDFRTITQCELIVTMAHTYKILLQAICCNFKGVMQ